MKVKSCRFLRSVAKPADLPDLPHPRIAFAGRSNVGKSSLLNRLVGMRAVARVSRTPGRTRLVNFFLVNERIVFMDLPGYGYARVPAAVREGWGRISERALLTPDRAALTVLLVDSRHPPTELDRQMAQWLTHERLSWVPVLTKIDKLRASARARMMDGVGALGGDAEAVATSARTGSGIADLWKRIEAAGGGRTGRASER